MDLSKMRKEDILNSDLIGEGIPDLGEEIAKIQSGSNEEFANVSNEDVVGDLDGFGFAEPDEQIEEEED